MLLPAHAELDCAARGSAPELPRVPADTHVLAMPAGPTCDQRCSYCYYRQKLGLFSLRPTRMSARTLATFIRQYIASRPPGAREAQFNWQGGEPTLVGLDFYRYACDIQQAAAPAGMRCTNTLQTHGLHLDGEWITFLRTQRFLVGLSIDGPPDLHDLHRRDAHGRGTGKRALHAMQTLCDHDVPFNVLAVVHRDNVDHPTEVYDFLVEQGVEHIQFIPLVIPDASPGAEPGAVRPPSVEAGRYGAFLCRVFDRWLSRDVGHVFVQGFESALACWLGRTPSLCTWQRTCGNALALEHNGDVYACDHFVDPGHRLGNIHETPLSVLASASRQRHFGLAKAELSPACAACDVRFACQGGCPKDRILTRAETAARHNYLCAGLQAFFRHIDRPMREMAARLRAGRPAADTPASVLSDYAHEQRKQATS